MTEYASAKDIGSTYSDLQDNPIFSKILSKVGYQSSEAVKVCEKVLSMLLSYNSELATLTAQIRRVISNFQIVYLPTYRRIELALAEEEESKKYGRRVSIQSKLGTPRSGLFSADINFGLSDIALRLSELNSNIQMESNFGYREISANIINELLDGTFERENISSENRPEKEALALFFARLKDTQNHRYFYHADFVIPDIDKIYTGGASSGAVDKFLQFFLGKLNKVILATRSTEKMVEEFVSSCNGYLNNVDDSVVANVDLSTSAIDADEKILVLNRKDLSVSVKSIAANREVPLDALSSGEKQMISLFARLYLYEGKKIVLVDEPELSLSIDWQRKILRDVISSPSCAQVVAITHSPFVFENELEPYAKSLSVSVDVA